MPVPVPRWDAPLRLLGDAGIQEPIRKKNGGGGGQVRAFSFSRLLATRHATLTTFHFSILVWAKGTTSLPFLSYVTATNFYSLVKRTQVALREPGS